MDSNGIRTGASQEETEKTEGANFCRFLGILKISVASVISSENSSPMLPTIAAHHCERRQPRMNANSFLFGQPFRHSCAFVFIRGSLLPPPAREGFRNYLL